MTLQFDSEYILESLAKFIVEIPEITLAFKEIIKTKGSLDLSFNLKLCCKIIDVSNNSQLIE